MTLYYKRSMIILKSHLKQRLKCVLLRLIILTKLMKLYITRILNKLHQCNLMKVLSLSLKNIDQSTQRQVFHQASMLKATTRAV